MSSKSVAEPDMLGRLANQVPRRVDEFEVLPVTEIMREPAPLPKGSQIALVVCRDADETAQ